MDAATAARLLALNKQFYQTFGREFSSTRQRLQPGVQQVLDMLAGKESILDLGCGNGELARELTVRGCALQLVELQVRKEADGAGNYGGDRGGALRTGESGDAGPDGGFPGEGVSGDVGEKG